MKGFWRWLRGIWMNEEGEGERAWVIDPHHSRISWYVIYSGNVKVEGVFHEFRGDFQGTAPRFLDLRGEIVIQVASLDTHQPIRDERLRGPEFFDVERYPEIRFVVKRLEVVFLRRYRLVGDLTIKGVTREVGVTGRIRSYTRADAMFGLPRVGFEVSGVIRRSDFGVIWEEEKKLRSEEGAEVISDEVWMKAFVQLVPPEALQRYEAFFRERQGFQSN